VQSGEYTRWTTENLFSSLNPHLIQKHANLFAALREMGASVLGEGAEGPENKPLLGADDDEAGPDFSDYDLDEGQGPEQYQ
jgi:hypothetical protein